MFKPYSIEISVSYVQYLQSVQLNISHKSVSILECCNMVYALIINNSETILNKEKLIRAGLEPATELSSPNVGGLLILSTSLFWGASQKLFNL